MAASTHTIETQALSLPLQERAQLVVTLLDSIEQRPSADPRTVQEAWLQESNRRYEAYLRGEEDALPAEQFFAQLRSEDH